MSTIENTTKVSLTNLATEFSKSTDMAAKTNKATELSEVTDSSTANKLINSGEQQAVVLNAGQAKEVNNQPLTTEQLENVAQQLQSFVGDMNRGLEFSVDKDSGRDVIKVIDKNSGDLVKQYPSEEVLTLVAKLSDMIGGFVDAKV